MSYTRSRRRKRVLARSRIQRVHFFQLCREEPIIKKIEELDEDERPPKPLKESYKDTLRHLVNLNADGEEDESPYISGED